MSTDDYYQKNWDLYVTEQIKKDDSSYRVLLSKTESSNWKFTPSGDNFFAITDTVYNLQLTAHKNSSNERDSASVFLTVEPPGRSGTFWKIE